MFTFNEPTPEQVCEILAHAATSALSYESVGATRDDAHHVAGFTHDHARVQVGHGAPDFEAACNALRAWVMFPKSFTTVHPANAPIATGTNVFVAIRLFGLTWRTTSRVVYVINEHLPLRFGFAYGTLAEHPERGEERFLVEQLADGSVWYDLRAFSKPNYLIATLGHPFVRASQRRFREESCAAVKQFVLQATHHNSSSQRSS